MKSQRTGLIHPTSGIVTGFTQAWKGENSTSARVKPHWLWAVGGTGTLERTRGHPCEPLYLRPTMLAFTLVQRQGVSICPQLKPAHLLLGHPRGASRFFLQTSHSAYQRPSGCLSQPVPNLHFQFSVWDSQSEHGANWDSRSFPVWSHFSNW